MSTKANYINKETPTNHEILDLLKNRWSPRVFSEKVPKEAQLKQLFEAGRWAPSSNNIQPWVIFYGIKGTPMYDRIYSCLVEFNQGWAKHAPVLAIGAYKKDMPDGQKENFHALHDLGAFSAMLSVQATSMDIAVHQMAGIKFEDAKKEFKLPDNYHAATAMAIGFYGGDPKDLGDDLEKQELKKTRERKPQSAFIFNGDFKK